MAVLNVHSRRLPAAAEQVGVLLDSLASPADRLWPHQTWPSMRFDRPLEVGAVGGHGPIRYRIEAYLPGRWIRFRFTAPRGFDGFHEYIVRESSDGHATLQHLCTMRLRGSARLTWPLFYRPLHDALIEDSIDLAEWAATAASQPTGRWTYQVRLLRALSGRIRRRAARGHSQHLTPPIDGGDPKSAKRH
ncbi:SRPBCC family protein [Frankia sp. CNm7]|uniref:SRPBCC family protein n=1 Tax=Frankia nepalensis TaxID=1836974 RepID=A0A937UMY4_9ACTN|nr:hypothetical protein [Frankia nepalensis]MBL7496623.1 SRPBCC family protein [Frankia nepalensis]MBL7511881.1 SRPBCC family protein [Frankia nepalensis]MBL7516632.1 SRPBCC family protein [Frankia nepalensis]MBL7627362.1 hypothetical protein [Frankia nepalensis]